MKPDPEFDPARRYQQEIRDSLFWDEKVREFGEEEGERILQGSFAFKIR